MIHWKVTLDRFYCIPQNEVNTMYMYDLGQKSTEAIYEQHLDK